MPARKRTSHRRAASQHAANAPWKTNKTALVTGASGGLGYDLASVFAENGYNLVLVARNEEKMHHLANQARQMFGVSAMVIGKDLTRPEAPIEIARELEKRRIKIDVLVNNAGFGRLAPFAHAAETEQLGMLQLNITALAHLTRLFLPAMIRNGGGRILNIASTAGFQPGPYMASYYASKAFVISFSRALAEETRDHGITVSVLCPGPMATGFRQRAGIKQPALGTMADIDSRVVARSGFEGLMAGKTVIVPGVLNKIGTWAARFLPGNVVVRTLAQVQRNRME